MMRWMAVAVLGWVVSMAAAQRMSSGTPETSGTVVGHVYLTDAGGPARLAEVALQPVQVPSDDRPQAEKYSGSGFRVYRTGIDGGYRMLHVAPGSYYVVVKLTRRVHGRLCRC